MSSDIEGHAHTNDDQLPREGLSWLNSQPKKKEDLPFFEDQFTIGRKVRQSAHLRRGRTKRSPKEAFRLVNQKAVFLQQIPHRNLFALNGHIPVPEGAADHILLLLNAKYRKKSLKVEELAVESDETFTQRGKLFILLRAFYTVVPV